MVYTGKTHGVEVYHTMPLGLSHDASTCAETCVANISVNDPCGVCRQEDNGTLWRPATPTLKTHHSATTCAKTSAVNTPIHESRMVCGVYWQEDSATGWRREVSCLIVIHHFPHKSPKFSCTFSCFHLFPRNRTSHPLHTTRFLNFQNKLCPYE